MGQRIKQLYTVSQKIGRYWLTFCINSPLLELISLSSSFVFKLLKFKDIRNSVLDLIVIEKISPG